MSRAFVKEDERDTEIVAKRPPRQHPYYVTPHGYEMLQQRLAAAQVSGDEREVEELSERLEEAVVVVPKEQPPGIVGFGAAVTVAAPDGKRSTYRIVGEDEADPLRGRISWLSPLAQALLEHRAGERVLWQRPAGNLAVRIVSISYSD